MEIKKTETFENFDDGVTRVAESFKAIKTNNEIVLEILKEFPEKKVSEKIFSVPKELEGYVKPFNGKTTFYPLITRSDVETFIQKALLIKDKQTQEQVEALKELLKLAYKPFVGEIGDKKLGYHSIVIRIDKIFKTSDLIEEAEDSKEGKDGENKD